MVSILAAYVLAVAGASTVKAKSLERPREKLWLLAAFPAMHIGWGVGFWEGFLRDLTRRSALQQPVLAQPDAASEPESISS